MKTFARVENGTVVELFATDQSIENLFSPKLTWVDVSSRPEVTEGWSYDGLNFGPHVPAQAPSAPSLNTLQAELKALALKIQAISSS